jgi:hypothetical protein
LTHENFNVFEDQYIQTNYLIIEIIQIDFT